MFSSSESAWKRKGVCVVVLVVVVVGGIDGFLQLLSNRTDTREALLGGQLEFFFYPQAVCEEGVVVISSARGPNWMLDPHCSLCT